jgi:hypothetical protein
VALGVYHRDDAELHLAVLTRVDRETSTAAWVSTREGDKAEVAEQLKEVDLLPRLQATTSVDDLPSMTDAKRLFGDGYKDVVRRMVRQEIVVAARYKKTGPGAPRIVLMLPRQFPDLPLVPLEEL